MKRIIALILLAGSVSAQAQPGFRYYHHHGYYPGPNYGWVAPSIIGGVIGYEIARNQPPVIVQQPVIVQPTPVPPVTVYYGQTQTCTEWTEVQQPDGTVTRTRTCRQ
jgi:hypothetical protein